MDFEAPGPQHTEQAGTLPHKKYEAARTSYMQTYLLDLGHVMRTLACSVHGVVAETRQIHTDYQVLWRQRDSTATLSRGEHPDPCLDRLLLLLWAHYIEDDPHLLCTGSL